MDADRYNVICREGVWEFSDWLLVNVPINSTVRDKNKIENYYSEVNKMLAKLGVEKTLFVGNMKDKTNITMIPNENVAHHYGLKGHNEWSDLVNILIDQTPNLYDVHYILRYLCDDPKTVSEALNFKKSSKPKFESCRFEKSKLDFIRTSHLCDHTYQALRRINRLMQEASIAVVIMKNDEVMKIMRNRMKGCQFKVWSSNQFIFKETKQEKYNKRREDNSLATKFINMCIAILEGKPLDLKGSLTPEENAFMYQKKDVRAYLGIEKASHLVSKVLDKTNVIEFCNQNNIIITTRGIIFPIQKSERTA